MKGSPVAGPLAQIADTSRDCVDAMSDIVWAVNPQRDHLSDLAHRMRRFAEDLLDAKNIDFTIRSALDEKDVPLGADLRREVYLIFKECINNLVKHSGCTEAAVVFSVSGPWLVVSITDNGKGFDPQKTADGSGLKNIETRVKMSQGEYRLETAPQGGTRYFITFEKKYLQ